jgi:hypothetical protein
VQDDGPPTLPSLRRLRSHVSRASREFGEPTRSNTWPAGRSLKRPPTSHKRPPLILGASLGVNLLLLVVLLSVLVLDHGGLAPSNDPARSSSSASRVTDVSTKAGLAAPTPVPTNGWLQVTPTNLQLSCNNGQQAQFVVLENTGTEPVQWQAMFSEPANQVGVNVTPSQGTLNAGTSTPLQIQNQTYAHGPQGVAEQQGTIEFNLETVGVGPSPTLTYTTMGC